MYKNIDRKREKGIFILLFFIMVLIIGFSSKADDRGWPRTIKGLNGREVVLEKKPERVVVTHYGNVIWLMHFDIVPVGSGMVKTLEIFKPIDPDNKMESITDIGEVNSPNWEKITELKPDLIIIGSWQEDMYEIASKIAPTYIQTKEDGIWTNYLDSLGKILGEEQKAKEMKDETEKLIKDTREKLSVHNDKTFMLLRAFSDKIRLLGSSDNFAFSKDGFGLSYPEGYPEKWEFITMEGVLAFDPDYIILQDNMEENEKFKKILEESKLGQTLKAVKNNNIIMLEGLVNGLSPLSIKYHSEEILKILEEK